MNILVLCTGNSARSILLESILNHRSEGRIKAWSAGSRPAGRVHPQSLKLLAEKGYPTEGLQFEVRDKDLECVRDHFPLHIVVLTDFHQLQSLAFRPLLPGVDYFQR